MQITSLTPTEEQLMLLLWKLDSFYMKDVLEHHPEPKPHQNTVSTYLKILVEKKFLTTVKEGRVFHYKTSVPLYEYRMFLLNALIRDYFGNSEKELMATLVINPKKENSAEKTSAEETKTTESPIKEDSTEKNPIAEFISELTDTKKSKSKKKKKKDKKRKNK